MASDSLGSNFTPLESGVGGALIGLSAATMLVAHGRTAGISGIFASLRTAKGDELDWRALFLTGLVSGTAVWTLVGGDTIPEIPAPHNIFTYVAAGLLVGMGTKLANGCTSGHGICGLARGSLRSLVSVTSFMAAGACTVYVSRHGFAPSPGFHLAPFRALTKERTLLALSAAAVLATSLVGTARRALRRINLFLCGLSFGVGLTMSGMTHPDKVSGFLNCLGRWDPSLAFVMGGGLAVSAAGFQISKRLSRSACGDPMKSPSFAPVDGRLVLGSVLFGCGWGLGGLCPGPALANAALVLAGTDGARAALMPFIAAMALGSWAVDQWDNARSGGEKKQ